MNALCHHLLRRASACSWLFLIAHLVAQQGTPDSVNGSAGSPRDAAMRVQMAFVDVAKAVAPSVVTVRGFARRAAKAAEAADSAKGAKSAPAAAWQVAGEQADDYPGFQMVTAGSGFVVDPAGEVLTCLSPLKQADGTLPDLVDVEANDGSRMIAEIVGTEPTVNLAIVQCTVFPTGKSQLPALRFGDSDAMQCGQWVVGFGDPAGPEKFVAAGTFIARPTRDCYQDYLSAFLLQIAMTAPPQAYGGPIVDLSGNVIGVLAPRNPTPGNPAEPRFGIEYAMPSKIVEGLYSSIRQVRSFQSPWLGFSVMSRAEIAKVRGLEAFQALPKPKQGIMIENVFSPSPAASVDIHPGDFLMALDTTTIFAPVDFQKALYLAGIGKHVRLKMWREGTEFEREITIEKRPAEATPR